MNEIQKENKIFVIDDDKDIRQILKSLLESANYSVEDFEHGYEAVERIRKVHPKILLLDYFLPGEKAETIISQLQSDSHRTLVIILMSANMHIVMDYEKLGVAEFIRKPFSIDTIFSTIKKYSN